MLLHSAPARPGAAPLAAAILAALLAIACDSTTVSAPGGDGDNPEHEEAPEADGADPEGGEEDAEVHSGDVAVAIRGFRFVPADLVVEAGSTVTWTNDDTAPHTVTSGSALDADAGARFDSGSMERGARFSRRFDEPGDFPYFCRFHPEMVGRVRVVPGSTADGDADGDAEGSPGDGEDDESADGDADDGEPDDDPTEAEESDGDDPAEAEGSDDDDAGEREEDGDADGDEDAVAEEEGMDAEEDGGEEEGEDGPDPVEHAVAIRGMAFDPATRTVRAGDTVVWTNVDAVPHTVTALAGGEPSSPILAAGASYRVTFGEPGTVEYRCNIHTTMRGRVVVETP